MMAVLTKEHFMPAVKNPKKKVKKTLKGVFVVTTGDYYMSNGGKRTIQSSSQSYNINDCEGGMSNPNVQRYVDSWSANRCVISVTLVDEKLRFTELYRNHNIQI
jgi:hypothetical protein